MDIESKRRILQRKMDEAFRREEELKLLLEVEKYKYKHELESLERKYGPGLGVGNYNFSQKRLIFHHTNHGMLTDMAQKWFDIQREFEGVKNEILRLKRVYSEL